LTTTANYGSSCLPIIHFGAPLNQKYIARIEFPDGSSVRQRNLISGNTYLIDEKNDLSWNFRKLTENLLSVIYRPKYRFPIIQLSIFILILALLNIFIFLNTYWIIINILFYNISLISLYILSTRFFKSNEIGFMWFFPFYIILIAGIFLYNAIQKYYVYQYRQNRLNELYDLLRQFSHSKEGMNRLDHLIFYFNNLSSIQRNEKTRNSFSKEIKIFRNITLPMLYKIIDESKKVGISHSQLKPIIKYIRSLQSIFGKDRQIVLDSFSRDPSTNNFLINLKKEIINLHKETERFFTCDLIQILNESLSDFPEFSEIIFINHTQKKSITVIHTAEDLKQVFTNLFQNSYEAMKEKEYRKIKVEILNIQMGYVHLLIQDFGEGIPNHYQNFIFADSFSMKGSSGLGLFHAQKLLRRFGGDIQLLSSTPEEGTTFQLKIKVANHG